MSAFTPHPDFDASSYRQACAVTNLPRQKADLHAQPHEVDDFILRGPEIVFHDGRGEVTLGFFDVRKAAIREAASQHLGMVPRDEVDALRAQLAGRSAALADALTEIEGLKQQVSAMILANAELITDSAGLRDELDKAYSELYEDYDPGSEDVLDLDEDELLSLEALADAEAG